MNYKEIYFYTATIRNWKPLIRDYKFEDAIINSLSFLCNKNCLAVYGFVIMPNHIHLIWEMLAPNGKEIPSASFMKFTAHLFEKKLKETNSDELESYRIDGYDRKYNFWLEKPDIFLLNNPVTIAQKLNYMHANPLQAHWRLAADTFFYPYSSARFYETGEKNFSFLSDYRDWQG